MRRKASNPRGHKFLFHRHHTLTQQPPKNQAKLLKQWIDLSLTRYVSARQVLNIHLHSRSAQGTVLEFISTHGYMPSLDSSRSISEVSLTWGFVVVSSYSAAGSHPSVLQRFWTFRLQHNCGTRSL